MRCLNIKILKSKGWKYDKVLKTWNHKQHDFTVQFDKINSDVMRFWELYKKDIYVRDLKDKGKFIPLKEFKIKKKKWENTYLGML